MKKTILIALGALAIVLAAAAALLAWYLGDRDEAAWTTCSSEALEEFEEGYEARSKRYVFEARERFERALELDPNFVAAKLYLAWSLPGSRSERARLMNELRQVDLEPLRPAERFQVRYALAFEDGNVEGARELTQAYLEEYPDDIFGIRAECEIYWQTQSWTEAESCYRRLLRLHPNWVVAQNGLGYIAMAQGRFDEAEEHFRTYRYIAPDQANPHESLAELLILRGRYDEAAEALHRALEIKPDFCIAYLQQADLHAVVGNFEEARRAVDRLEALPACRDFVEMGSTCALRALFEYQEGDYEAAWRRMADGCLARREEGYDHLAHRLAILTGREAEAEELEKALGALLAKLEAVNKPVWVEYLRAIQAHSEGVRHLLDDDPLPAIERFRAADDWLTYWGAGLAGVKLYNRLNLLRALEAAGRDAEARKLRREIDAVNPRLLSEFPAPDLDLPER